MDLLPLEKWIYIRKETENEGSWVYICEKKSCITTTESQQQLNTNENSTTITTIQNDVDNTVRPTMNTIPIYQPDVNQLLVTTQYATRTTNTTIYTTANSEPPNNSDSTYNSESTCNQPTNMETACEPTLVQTTGEAAPGNALKSIIMNTPLTNPSNSTLTSYSTMMDTTWDTSNRDNCTTSTTPINSQSNTSLLDTARQIEEMLSGYTPPIDLSDINMQTPSTPPAPTHTSAHSLNCVYVTHDHIRTKWVDGD